MNVKKGQIIVSRPRITEADKKIMQRLLELAVMNFELARPRLMSYVEDGRHDDFIKDVVIILSCEPNVAEDIWTHWVGKNEKKE